MTAAPYHAKAPRERTGRAKWFLRLVFPDSIDGDFQVLKPPDDLVEARNVPKQHLRHGRIVLAKLCLMMSWRQEAQTPWPRLFVFCPRATVEPHLELGHILEEIDLGESLVPNRKKTQPVQIVVVTRVAGRERLVLRTVCFLMENRRLLPKGAFCRDCARCCLRY